MYITMCEIDHQFKFDECNRHSKPVHRDYPGGWDGKGNGRGLWDEGQYNKNRGKKLDCLFVVEL